MYMYIGSLLHQESESELRIAISYLVKALEPKYYLPSALGILSQGTTRVVWGNHWE